MTSEYENTVVQGLLNGATTPENGWIGGSDTDTEGTWVWADSTAFSFLNWHTSEKKEINIILTILTQRILDQPGNTVNQNCMRMRKIDGKWDDVPCAPVPLNTKAFVCKKK